MEVKEQEGMDNLNLTSFFSFISILNHDFFWTSFFNLFYFYLSIF